MNAITSFRLELGQAIELTGTRYTFCDRKHGRKRFRNEMTGDFVWVEESELSNAFLRGELVLTNVADMPQSRVDLQAQHFSDLPETTRQLAMMRHDYVVAMLANIELGYRISPNQVIDDVFERRRKSAVDERRAFSEKKPGKSSVYGWRAAWEAPGVPTIMRLVLAESMRGKRGFTFPEHVDAIVRQSIGELYLTPQRLLVGMVHDRVTARCASEGLTGKQVPSLQTVRRVVQRLSPRIVMEARRGKRSADLVYGSVGKTSVPEMPGEVLEIDAHQLNLWGVDERSYPLGRLWVTTAIDTCTRMIVGFHVHVGAPSSLSIAACLRNAIAPKDYVARRYPEIGREWPCWGMPVVVKLDNAFENKATFLTEAAMELGFTLHYTRPRTPEDKPFIERWFSTLENGLVRRLPGNTGLHPKDLGDYDAANMAVATEADVDMLMHRYVLTAYNCRPHKGIKDVPERLWVEKTKEWEVAPYTNVNSLEVLLGPIAWRKPSREGIRLLGLHFNGRGKNNFIEMIRSRAGAADLKKVRVRFDPYALDVIHVQDPVTMRYEAVESEDPEYTAGLTLARHLAIRQRATDRIRGYISIQQLCIQRDELQQEVESLLGSPQRSGRRTAYLLNARRQGGDEEIVALLARSESATNLDDLLEAEFDDEPATEPKGRRAGKSGRSPRTATELIAAPSDDVEVSTGGVVVEDAVDVEGDVVETIAVVPLEVSIPTLPSAADPAPIQATTPPAAAEPGRPRLSLAERRAAAGMGQGRPT